MSDWIEKSLRDLYGDNYVNLTSRVKLLYAADAESDKALARRLFAALTDADKAVMLPLDRELIGYVIDESYKGEIDWLYSLIDAWKTNGDWSALLNDHMDGVDPKSVSQLLRLKNKYYVYDAAKEAKRPPSPRHRLYHELTGYRCMSDYRGEIEWLAQLIDAFKNNGDWQPLWDAHIGELDKDAVKKIFELKEKFHGVQ